MSPIRRKLAKQVQSELAEANSVAEEVLSSMTTVKAHAAEQSANAAYRQRLGKFYSQMVEHAQSSHTYSSSTLWMTLC